MSPAEPLLCLHDVRMEFPAHTALADLSLELPPGLIGLLGPNGAGKSTLLKILLGLMAPTSGGGRVLGVDLRSPDNWRLRQLIGFMPEADALVPGLTGVEYVSLAGELYGMPRKQAARRAQEVLTYLELEEARYRRIEQYSIGMKQRAKLAQALVHDPPLLLLDEPTSGLDPAGRDAMLRLIQELGRDHGKSVILSTHLLADVQTVCDQVVILADGKLRGVGRVEELCRRHENRFRLRIEESGGASAPGEPFVAALTAAGVIVRRITDQGVLLVRVPPGWPNYRFFELAQASGVVLRAMTRDDETLEEMFLSRVEPAEPATPSP